MECCIEARYGIRHEGVIMVHGRHTRSSFARAAVEHFQFGWVGAACDHRCYNALAS